MGQHGHFGQSQGRPQPVMWLLCLMRRKSAATTGSSPGSGGSTLVRHTNKTGLNLSDIVAGSDEQKGACMARDILEVSGILLELIANCRPIIRFVVYYQEM